MEYLIVTILIFFSALFSGLTIGFLGLNKTELERKVKIGEKKAARILTVRKNGNFLLVTLLLGNVLVNSILSVFLGNLFSGLVAVLVSTALIVVFGEILPQAVFYRHALSVGYYFVPLVKFFQFILYPIAYPISKVLDYFLGEEEETIWSKKEIKEIIKIHEDSEKSDIDKDEESILIGALTFSEKTAKEAMTPKKNVFRLELNRELDDNLLKEIKDSGYSRIPVYENDDDNIIGVLNVKALINLKDRKKVKEVFYKDKIIKVKEDDKLDNILNDFINNKVHISFVVNEHQTFLGILTLEDIMEEIISKEIIDETDN